MAHETYRRLSVHWQKKRVSSYVLEISFWLLQALIIFYCLFLVNAGELRLYIVLACLLGFSIYEVIFKRMFKRLLEVLISVVRAVYQFFKGLLNRLFFIPLKWIFLLCTSILLFLLKAMITVVMFLLKVIIYPLRLVGNFIKPLIPNNIMKLFHKLSQFYSTIRDTLKKVLKKVTLKRR